MSGLKLRALAEEVDAALEIHLAGRSATRFNRTAYVLADDCAELASKLFLLRRDASWSDMREGGRPKGFRAVTAEVRAAKPAAGEMLARIEERRDHRNGFFHSTRLLDLTLHNHQVDHALVDLLDYCALLFADAWTAQVDGMGAMETAALLVRLDYAARRDFGLRERVAGALAEVPRHGQPTQRRKGVAIVLHPDDLHLAVALRMGGGELRDRLRRLMPE